MRGREEEQKNTGRGRVLRQASITADNGKKVILLVLRFNLIVGMFPMKYRREMGMKKVSITNVNVPRQIDE